MNLTRKQQDDRAHNAGTKRAQMALGAGHRLYWRGDDWGIGGTEPNRPGVPLSVPLGLVAARVAVIEDEVGGPIPLCICKAKPRSEPAQRFRRDIHDGRDD